MTINLTIENMHEAERLSNICNKFPFEMYLRAGSKFCADPKSTLGVLAMMYADKNGLMLDTGDMPDDIIGDFTSSIADFVKPDPEEA